MSTVSVVWFKRGLSNRDGWARHWEGDMAETAGSRLSPCIARGNLSLRHTVAVQPAGHCPEPGCGQLATGRFV